MAQTWLSPSCHSHARRMVPLAARGLSAVLARAVPAGGGWLLSAMAVFRVGWSVVIPVFIEAPAKADSGARVVLIDGDVRIIGEFVHEE